MRVIIAGSRGIEDARVVDTAMQLSGFHPTLIVSGNARGVDKMGEKWAASHSIPCAIYPAQWDKYGKSAGYKRNEEMADNADALVAIWDGESPGTKHMIDIARSKNLKIHLLIIKEYQL